jgi:hypothetical protein
VEKFIEKSAVKSKAKEQSNETKKRLSEKKEGLSGFLNEIRQDLERQHKENIMIALPEKTSLSICSMI